MPIKPTPFILKCSHCGWKKYYVPPSDFIVEAIPDDCPKCGYPLKKSDVKSKIVEFILTIFSQIKTKL